jgi:hypothetical protein
VPVLLVIETPSPMPVFSVLVEPVKLIGRVGVAGNADAAAGVVGVVDVAGQRHRAAGLVDDR